jgi:hypothetical protein
MTEVRRPNLNSSEVRERKQFDGNFLYEPAFGRFTLALRFWQYEPRSDKQKVPCDYWVADMVIIKAEPDPNIPFGIPAKDKVGKRIPGQKISTANLYPAGKTVKLKFPVGRGPTANDAQRDRRDDQMVADFIAALFRTTRDDPNFDGNAAFAALEKQKKFDDNKLQLIFDREPQAKPKDVLDPSTGEVLKSTTLYFTKDRFLPVQ